MNHEHTDGQPELPADGLPDGYEVDQPDAAEDRDEDTHPREELDAARTAAASDADAAATPVPGAPTDAAADAVPMGADAREQDAPTSADADADADAGDATTDADSPELDAPTSADADAEAAAREHDAPTDADAVGSDGAADPEHDDATRDPAAGAAALTAGAGARTARSVERVEDESVEPADPARRRYGIWIAVGALVLLLGGIATTIGMLANADPVAAPKSTASVTAAAQATPTAVPTDTAAASATPAPTASATLPVESETPVLAPQLPPVPPTDPATGSDGVIVELSKVEAVDGEGNMPGEINGPAIRLTVQLENKSSTPIDLNTIVVNAYTGADNTPANPILEPGGAPFTGSLEVGKRATGVYLFTVPVAARSDVLIGVDYRVGTSTVTFRGEIG